MQDAYVRAYQYRRQFEGRSTFVTRPTRIALCTKHLHAPNGLNGRPASTPARFCGYEINHGFKRQSGAKRGKPGIEECPRSGHFVIAAHVPNRNDGARCRGAINRRGSKGAGNLRGGRESAVRSRAYHGQAGALPPVRGMCTRALSLPRDPLRSCCRGGPGADPSISLTSLVFVHGESHRLGSVGPRCQISDC